jgi:hypothetical protein
MKRKKVGKKFIDGMQEKALFRQLKRRPRFGRPSRRIYKPAYDGDGDGFIMNPATGKDDLPFAQGDKRPRPKKASLGEFSPSPGKSKPREPRFEQMTPGAGGSGRRPPRLPRPATPPDPDRFPNEFTDSDGYVYLKDGKAIKIGDQWINGENTMGIVPVPPDIPLSLREWNGLPVTLRDELSAMVDDQRDNDTEFYEELKKMSRREWLDMVEKDFMMAQRKENEKDLRRRRRSFDLNAGDASGSEETDADSDDPMSEMRNMVDEAMDSPSSGREFDLTEYAKTFLALWRNSREANKQNPNYWHKEAGRLTENELYSLIDTALPAILALEDDAKIKFNVPRDKNLPNVIMRRLIRTQLEREMPAVAHRMDIYAAADVIAELLGYDSYYKENGIGGIIDASTIDAILDGRIRDLFNQGFSWDRRGDFAYLPIFQDEFDGSAPPLWIGDTLIESIPSSEVPLEPTNPNWRPYIEQFTPED